MSTSSEDRQESCLLAMFGRKIEHLDLAVCFFAVFSRFEYALKSANYVDNGHSVHDVDDNKRRLAKPDWKKYANELEEGGRIQDSEKHDPRFASAVYYLTMHPPSTQVVGDPRWVKKKAAPGHSRELLERVREVRNNLFHGGKEWPYPGTERDKNLLLAGIIVLSKCLELTSTVAECFCDGLTGVDTLVERLNRLPSLYGDIESD